AQKVWAHLELVLLALLGPSELALLAPLALPLLLFLPEAPLLHLPRSNSPLLFPDPFVTKFRRKEHHLLVLQQKLLLLTTLHILLLPMLSSLDLEDLLD